MSRVVTSAAFGLVVVSGLLAISLRAASPHVPSGTWTTTKEMSQVRVGASAVLLPDGFVLLTGGSDGAGASATTERFNPQTHSFVSTPPMLVARANHTSTVLGDGRVLVVGGTRGDGRTTTSSEIYDPGANVWLGGAPMNAARSNHTATLLQDGRVLISGGDDGGVAINTAEIFDPAAGSFSLVDGTLSATRTGHAASLLHDGRVLIIGGFDGTSTLASTDIFESGSNSVSPGPSLGTARAGHTATTLLGGQVFVTGGASDNAELASTEVFDPGSETFSPAAPLSAARQRHQAFLLPHNNSVLIVGGTRGGSSVQLAELYQPWNFTFVPTGSPSSGRMWATGSALSFPANDVIRSGPTDGVLLFAGGSPSTDGTGATRSADLYGFVTVNTDRSDYSPGETVTITGSGWQPGEIVALTLVEQPLLDTHPLVPVQADDRGNIVSAEFAPDEHDIGIRFILTAYGSSSQAQTTFTDSVTSVTITSPTNATPQTITSLPATVVVSFDYITSPTGATTATADILGAGLSNSVAIAAGTSSDSVSVTVPAGTPNGTYNLKVTVTNSTGGGSNQKNDNQNGAVIVNVPTCTTPSVTSPTSQTVTYGNNAVFTASATGTPAPTLQWEVSTNGGASWNPIGGATSSTLTITSPTVAQTGTRYRAVFTNTCATVNSTAAALTVNRANAVITVTPYHVTYDAASHTATGTATGVGGAVLSGLDLSGTTHTDAGDYPADPWAFTDSTGNYNNATGTVHDRLDKTNATIHVSGYTGIYDGAAHAASGTATGVGGVDLSAGLSLGQSFTNVPGGIAHWKFTGGTNYNDADGNVSIAIDRANAVIVVTPYSVIYNATAHAATGSATGVLGESLSGLDLTGTTHINAGSYTDNWTFTAETGNYNSTSGTVHDEIARADAVIDVTPYSVTYDGAAHTATGTAKGVLGEELTGLDLSGTTHTNAGNFSADPWSFTDSTGNYNHATGSVHDVIAKANAVIVVTPYNVTYNAAAHTAVGTATGVLGENLSADLNLSGTTHTDAGDYLTDSWTFAGGVNYNDATGSVHDVIAKANAVIVVTPYSVTYNAAAHTAVGTATGVLGENLSADLNLSGTTHTDAGDYLTDGWTFAGGVNYNDATGTVHDVIAKANAVIVVTPYSVTYSAAPHTATGTATGVIGEDLSAGFDLSGTTHTNAGDYPTDGWTFAGGVNYNNAAGTVHDKIDKANATVNVSGYTGVYNGAAHGAGGSATGVNGMDLSSGLHLGATFTNVPGGTTHWTFEGGTNYHDRSGDVAIVISKANPVIGVTPYSVTYDGAAHMASGTAKGVLNENLSGLNLSATTHTSAGTYSDTWTFTDITGNYNDATGTITDSIYRRPVTVTAEAKTKVLGALDPPLTYQVTPGSIVSGDGFTGHLVRAAGETIGIYAIQQGTLTLGPNYQLSFIGANLSITYSPGGLCLGAPGHSILQPVDANGSSVFKQKSTVPAKFRVCDANGQSVGTPGVVASFLLVRVLNGTTTDYPNESVDSTTPDAAFRWSSTDQQWIFNVNTKGLTAGMTYVYQIKLNDNSIIEFGYGLK